ncbi:hypothetical protein SRB17_61620 [Streptomyces sp. RB17]|nr:hypothetical protein [Streptomyces sp. RB17]
MLNAISRLGRPLKPVLRLLTVLQSLKHDQRAIPLEPQHAGPGSFLGGVRLRMKFSVALMVKINRFAERASLCLTNRLHCEDGAPLQNVAIYTLRQFCHTSSPVRHRSRATAAPPVN